MFWLVLTILITNIEATSSASVEAEQRANNVTASANNGTFLGIAVLNSEQNTYSLESNINKTQSPDYHIWAYNNTQSYEVMQSFVDDRPGNLSNMRYDTYGYPVVDLDPLAVMMLFSLLTEHNELYHYDYPGHRTVIEPPRAPERSSGGNYEDAAQLDISLSGEYDPVDEASLLEMIIDKPPKLVRQRRAFFNKQNAPWPSGEYFYVFDRQLDPASKRNILQSFEKISQEVPCVKFLPASPHTQNYIVHTSQATGCFASTLGFKPGVSILNVAAQCNLGVTMHEIFHILGAIHTQTRPDRDQYVKVHWERIMPSTRYNFRKTSLELSDYDYEYDYASTMQYPAIAFASKPGSIVLSATLPGVSLPYNSHNNFSPADYTSLRDWYGCGARCPTFSTNCPTGTDSVEQEVTEREGKVDLPNTNKILPKTNKKTHATKFKVPISRDSRTRKETKQDIMKKIALLFEKKEDPKGRFSYKKGKRSAVQTAGEVLQGTTDCLLSPWSEWSVCNSDNRRTRFRTVSQRSDGQGVKCPPDSELLVVDSCIQRTASTTATQQHDTEVEKAVANVKKLVTVVEGGPIVLVVSNPQDFEVHWYHVKNGEDSEVGSSDLYKTEHTTAGNDRLVLEHSTLEYDGEIIACQVYMGNTILRIAWAVEIDAQNEVL